MQRYVVTFAALIILLGQGCNDPPANTGPQYGTVPDAKIGAEYHFAIHPLHNPAKMTQAYQPLIDALNANLQGVHFTLEASRDYASFEKKYQARQPEFLLPNPWQTLQAMQVGYSVIAMAGEPTDFKGLFIVRQDSGIKAPSDLKGHAVSYPSATALAACIMPQYFLHRHGLNINKDIENRYVGSQESSILNVYLHETVAGATWPPPWRAFQAEHPAEAAALRVIWETESLINNSVMVHNDVPVPVREQVQHYLIKLNETGPGRLILLGMETARFLPASDHDYDVARSFMTRFESEVRKVESP